MTGKLKIVKTDDEIARAWHQAAIRVAIIAALFSIIGGVMLGQASILKQANNPYNNPQIMAWNSQLSKEMDQVKKDALIEQIRKRDVVLNQEFFKADAFIRYGEFLLVGGLAFFILGAQLALKYREKLPEPQRKSVDNVWIAAGMSRRTTIMVGVLLIGGMVAIVAKSPGDPFAALAKVTVDGGIKIVHTMGMGSSATTTEAIPNRDDGSSTPGSNTVTITIYVDRFIIKEVEGISSGGNGDALRNWPSFRGPLGIGFTFGARPPFKWNSETGENILWKVPVALPGMSSPIVWEDKIFISGATEDKREVYCYNGTTGELLWTKEVSAGDNEPKEKPTVFPDTGFAAPTMATDGNKVYAMFANGDVAGFDLDGNNSWVVNNWGIPVSNYGYSSSLLPFRNRLIVQLDQEMKDITGAPITRRISCLDGKNGAEIWHTDRPADSGDTWSSPVLINTGTKEMIVTAGRPFAIAYDPLDGKELWRKECLGGDVGPSPIYAGGLIFVAEESEKLTALRPEDGSIVWQAENDMPNTVSPVSNGDLVFVTSGEGKVSCFDVAIGKLYWQHQFGSAGAYASPVLVGNSVFFTDRKGTTYIFPAERTFFEIESESLRSRPLGLKWRWMISAASSGCTFA